MSILALNQLEAAALITGYDKQLRRRAMLKDIYVNLQGLYNRTEQAIPNAIYMKFDEKALAGSNSARVTMKLPLVGAPVLGNTRMIGTEEAPVTKSATVYRNDYKKAVRVHTYGVRQVDQASYGLYKAHIDDLGTWAQQYKGLDIRTTALQTYGMTLWFGDTINLCVPFWHPHIYVGGATDANQPAYSTNLTTFTNNIVGSILSAGGGALTPTNAQTFIFRTMNKLVLRALDEKIRPLQIGGNDAFLFVISPHQASLFGDPTFNVASSAAALWYQQNRVNQTAQNWNGILGMYKSSAGADVYVVVDPKCPTLLPSGSSAPYTLTAGYVWPGDVDLRNRTNPNIRDACMFYGAGAFMEWEPEKLHFVKQDDEYSRIMGHGIAGVRGYQQVHFDQASPTNTSKEYYGSILAVLGRIQNY
ncbi:MAG TPA: hypothetical protein VMZ24_02495 [Patescibacteria group bacterium]|nr:hypothetical protein [Patescibacteria group bacterium]